MAVLMLRVAVNATLLTSIAPLTSSATPDRKLRPTPSAVPYKEEDFAVPLCGSVVAGGTMVVAFPGRLDGADPVDRAAPRHLPKQVLNRTIGVQPRCASPQFEVHVLRDFLRLSPITQDPRRDTQDPLNGGLVERLERFRIPSSDSKDQSIEHARIGFGHR
ncbi:hypothetical protein MT353_15920 [Rathayibacter sp. VKM Ac-2927]|nr:hypothetical protein [Rathayibacter sp. VKM Ac-2927]MCJ1688541.1 hypothetical protein [Rathayibacter sp. VKM Ac-2927]